jgi:hypothetical protein
MVRINEIKNLTLGHLYKFKISYNFSKIEVYAKGMDMGSRLMLGCLF